MHSFHVYPVRLVFAGLAILLSLSAAFAALHSISGANYLDPGRTMFEDFNNAFARHWKARSGVDVSVRHVRTRSGESMRAAVDGLDVITLGLSYDVEALQKNPPFTLPDWQKPILQNSPYTSTIVFLVRKGNPKRLKDWNDLIRPDVEVIASNPKTSGAGRWGYLAAWGYALKQSGGNEAVAFEFINKLLGNVKILDPDTHGATAAFVERGIGDVLLVWESEAHWLAKEQGSGRLEVITPAISILAEPTVSIVSEIPDRDGARDLIRAYIDYLYTPKAQDIAGKHYFRPRDEKAAEKYSTELPPIELFSIDEVFGGWKQAWVVHFAPGGLFDRIQHQQHLSSRTTGNTGRIIPAETPG